MKTKERIMEQRVFSHTEKEHFKCQFTSVLLYSSPCMNAGKCKFCSYWKDSFEYKNIIDQSAQNHSIIESVDWNNLNGALAILPSASFCELPSATILELRTKLNQYKLDYFITDFYWEYHKYMTYFWDLFPEEGTIFKVGLETFDNDFRKYLGKDYDKVTPEQAVKHFNGINLLVGVEGQTKTMVLEDIKKAEIFELCDINIFDVTQGTLKVDSDKKLIDWFLNEVEIPSNCKVWENGNEYLGEEG